MFDYVYRVIEIVGSLFDGIDLVIYNGVIWVVCIFYNFDWFEVIEIRGYFDYGVVVYV